jgi:hypothetical protein
MANGLYALLPLLGILAIIKRVRDNREMKSSELKLEETRTPTFPLPEKIGGIILNEEQQKERVWNELNRLHKENNWRCGVFETDQNVDTLFQIEENQEASYRYRIDKGELHFNVGVLYSFPTECTTDLFVLAAHFNNLLSFGKVVVEVHRRNVYFSYQNELSFYAVYPEKIDHHISQHFHISRDVYWAFQKYLSEREEPVIIISQALNRQEKRQENRENN